MAASHFLHPVSISRKIMEESHHCALSGAGAVEFARRIDFPTCEPEDLVDEETSLKKIYTYEDYPKLVGCLFEGKLVTDTHDTVAAVALDGNGHFACATSSGNINISMIKSFDLLNG
jgi:isoaspartyl peptidase/L-asparaginase-like protein (Ntn-hydrolase superfamily)